MNFNLIILLLLFRKIFFYSISYDIRDGVEKTFNFTYSSVDYSFIIYAEKAKYIIFNAKTTNGCKFSSLFDIYQYSDPKYPGYPKRISINGKTIGGVCEYYLVYPHGYSKYANFRSTVFDYSVKNKTTITIRMDLIYGEVNLNNGEPREIVNLLIL